MNNISMTVRKDGWVKGVAYGFTFTALVFSEPSEYGINQGRVSKLFMCEGSSPEPIVAYDRRWEKESSDKRTLAICMKLISGLESLPV